jgi:hypothetical protein
MMGCSLWRVGWVGLLATGMAAGHGQARCLPKPDAARVQADIGFLCGPDLDGRVTGTPGAARAAAFLAGRMGEVGLEPIRAGGFGGATPFHYTWKYDGAAGASAGPASDVVGVLPGRDPQLRAEYVFLTAHFDHLGRQGGLLYPGADDDASGTAALLELMRLLRDAGPRRSIAFLAVSGEEQGLLGSEAFLRQPPVSVSAIKADINMDMVGRGRTGELHVMPARKEGCVTTLTRDAQAVARRHGIVLSAGMDGFWRDSDHYSFARRRIPSICFNTGLHADYHQPTDTPDRIDLAKLARVIEIVGDLTLATANAADAPAFLPGSVWQAWAWGPYRTPGPGPEEDMTGVLPGPENGFPGEPWANQEFLDGTRPFSVPEGAWKLDSGAGGGALTVSPEKKCLQTSGDKVI